MAAALTAIAIWLALPSRNAFGNPSMEEQISSCSTSEGNEIRLYRGNGGATTAYWYTVISEGGLFEREKQILFTYSSPEITSIDCEGAALNVSGRAYSAKFSSDQLAVLRQAPHVYWRGKLDASR